MHQVLEAQEEPQGDDQSCQGGRHQGVAAQIQVVFLVAFQVAQDPQEGLVGAGATGYPGVPFGALLEGMRGGDCSWKQF